VNGRRRIYGVVGMALVAAVVAVRAEESLRIVPAVHEDRVIVSEPLSALPGMWQEVPESTALIIQDGPDIQRAFIPSG